MVFLRDLYWVDFCLLYTIYMHINDIDDSVACKILKFADDTKIYRVVKSADDNR